MNRDNSLTEKLSRPEDQSGGYQQYSDGGENRPNPNGQEPPSKPKSLIEIYCGPVNYDLLISKIFYFFFFGAFGSLFPLISVYFKQLGMNATQAGILIGIRPFIEYASAPFWGSFAERFRKGKALLLGSLVCWIVFTVSLAFITPYVPYCSSRNSSHHFNYLFRVENADAEAIQRENDLADLGRERNVLPVDHKPGIAPLQVTSRNYLNYEPSDGDLVKPPYSTKIYRKSGVEEVFLLLLLLTVIGVFFSAPAIALADSCTLAYLGDQPELYGKQRLFGSLGWGLAMFFVGIALDNSKAFATQACPRMDDREKNYVLCFAVFSVLMSCALIAATQFRFTLEDRTDKIPQKIFDSQVTKVSPAVAENLRARAPEPQELSGGGPKWLSALKTFRSPHYAAFLFVAFWFGVGIGLVFAFLFWHLQDIGGTSSLFGVASVVNHVSEIFAYFFSFKLINKVGHMRVLYIGLGANCARFLYVSWLKEPWWILPFEFIQGLTHSAVGATITSYISLTAPPNLKSSAQALVDALHMGVGRGVGALICGIVITYEGTTVVFRAYGLISLILAGLFFAINRFMKVDGIKYQASDLLEEAAIGPHGVPMRVNYSPSEEQLANNYSAGYGTLDDPTQEAYDRYIHEPYEKPVKFEAINIGGRNQ